MKQHKIIILLVAASFLLSACSKDRSQEEKITITIEKPDTQKSQEAVPKAEVQQNKSMAESQSRPERRPEKAARRPAADRSLDFKDVAEHLDLTKHSKQQIKDYFLSIRGKRVFWSGTVYQAKTSGRGFKILVENRNALTRSGYNIVLVKKGPTDVGDIPKGTDIRFSGVIIDVQPAKAGSGPVIVLIDTKIQN